MSPCKPAQSPQAHRKGTYTKPNGQGLDLHRVVESRVERKERFERRHNAYKADQNVRASEFVANETALPHSALGDLTNDILPLFAPANFPDIEDYGVIVPSLRLASKLLLHPSLHETLRTILGHGPLVPLGKNDVKGSPMYQYPQMPGTVNDVHVGFIHEAWEELAQFVIFRASMDQTSHITTTEALEGPPPNTEQLQGLVSLVEYSPQVIETLTRATENLAQTQDVPLLLAWRFVFAVQLAHEACHALVFANDGHRPEFDTEPFFPGEKTAEIGFKMEDTLFGGHFAFLWNDDDPSSERTLKRHLKSTGEASDLLGIPVVWPWPSPAVVREYQHHDCALWIREADLNALDSKEIGWRVPLLDLAKFFQTAFWHQPNPPTRLARKVGFAFHCDDKGKRIPHDVAEKELKLRVPAGYKLAKYKAIVRKWLAKKGK